MKRDKLDEILNLMLEFAKDYSEVLAFGLCGSWARGTAKSDSDIDLSILVKDKLRFKKTDWIKELELEKINKKVEYFQDNVYGQVWSRHVFLNNKTEIEFSFADKSWADTENLDEGTRKVVSDGFKIIYDPQLILKKLVEKVKIASE